MHANVSFRLSVKRVPANLAILFHGKTHIPIPFNMNSILHAMI